MPCLRLLHLHLHERVEKSAFAASPQTLTGSAKVKGLQMLRKEISSTVSAIGLALGDRKRFATVFVFAIAMAFLSIYIPVAITPGNTFEFQISLLKLDHILLMALFSVLFGISIALHSYVMGLKKSYKDLTVTPVAGFASILGGLFSGPLCASCISAIFSAIGFGSSTAFFFALSQNRNTFGKRVPTNHFNLLYWKKCNNFVRQVQIKKTAQLRVY